MSLLSGLTFVQVSPAFGVHSFDAPMFGISVHTRATFEALVLKIFLNKIVLKFSNHQEEDQNAQSLQLNVFVLQHDAGLLRRNMKFMSNKMKQTADCGNPALCPSLTMGWTDSELSAVSKCQLSML